MPCVDYTGLELATCSGANFILQSSKFRKAHLELKSSPLLPSLRLHYLHPLRDRAQFASPFYFSNTWDTCFPAPFLRHSFLTWVGYSTLSLPTSRENGPFGLRASSDEGPSTCELRAQVHLLAAVIKPLRCSRVVSDTAVLGGSFTEVPCQSGLSYLTADLKKKKKKQPTSLVLLRNSCAHTWVPDCG